ncbi:transcription repressor NadR [Mahella australiensis]|uniref:3H domain-containing protein n=1 Tax=Mahella australiensis (strain DSM 15567 / CIP 107919 / 50-1 BON) TaxID=697281 RepID=F3ZVZ8_MAHA5|nr:transcription repressor NadR [Mahella australiensis]AEE95372.1 3H domain-containing protein [Mahella australiensis 50-1 BON]
MFNGTQRREGILNKLKAAKAPITGTDLATAFDVSRQVIVQDIAILRAAGINIIATPQGYMLPDAIKQKVSRVFACRHTPEQIEDELCTIVSLGGKVIDVIIEHKVYGELRGLLMLSSISDIRDFMHKINQKGVEPLSSLTGGVHLHTVEADDIEILDKIENDLKRKGYLLDTA